MGWREKRAKNHRMNGDIHCLCFTLSLSLLSDLSLSSHSPSLSLSSLSPSPSLSFAHALEAQMQRAGRQRILVGDLDQPIEEDGAHRKVNVGLHRAEANVRWSE